MVACTPSLPGRTVRQKTPAPLVRGALARTVPGRTALALALLALPLFALLLPARPALAAVQVSVTTAAPGHSPVAAAPAAKSQSAAKPAQPLLPDVFAGWLRQGSAQPFAAPAADAAALKEYGFTDGLSASYHRGSETLTLAALRFSDATGAFGAYTYYRHSGWPGEQIGSGAASDHGHILFWQGNLFVDAHLSQVSATSAADLRELASDLPQTSNSLAPTVVLDLPNVPVDGPLQGQTMHYALGPAGYTDGALPPSLVGFDRSAEVVTASYRLRSGPATLTLINYPTPQIAMAAEQQIAAYIQAGNSPQHPWTPALVNSTPGSVLVKRSGPLVAVVSGDAVPDDARRLIGLVHYEANVSRLPGGGPTEVQKTAQLLMGILLLVAVLFVAAFSAAVFLGGGRRLLWGGGKRRRARARDGEHNRQQADRREKDGARL